MKKFEKFIRFFSYFLSILGVIIVIFFYFFKINVSESSPLGIYFINRFSKDYKVGDYIVYEMDKNYKKYANEKIRNLLTIKKIKGRSGDEIKYEDNNILLNNEVIGIVLKSVSKKVEDFYIIKEKEYFTFSDSEKSLDSRYYGTIKEKDIKYKAILIKRF